MQDFRICSGALVWNSENVLNQVSANFYEFGEFRLDANEKVLRRGDSIADVTPKAVEILLVLVENAGSIVSKEEIFRQVWTDSFVEEANLSHHIFRLRKVLGEDDEHKFIETIPKRGYRFVAEISRVNNNQQNVIPPTSGAEDVAAGKIKQHKYALAVGLLILLTAIGLGAWFYNNRSANTRQINSVAVMPFDNETGNADNEYLSDGMTESLINSLAQLPQLEVKARSSVFRYKDKDVSPQQIGSELSVQAILNGRIIQRGEQLTLSLELINAQTGNQIWGKQYNRKTTDLVSLQSEIARDVSNKLRVKLSRADKQQVTKQFTENNEAYSSYLQGRFYINQQTEKSVDKSIEFFDKAIALDPRYALAYAARAEAYYMLAGWTLSDSEGVQKTKADIATALTLDEMLVEALIISAAIKYQYDWDFPSAEIEFKKVIELNPNYPEARRQYGWYLTQLGRYDEGLAEMKLAYRLDPFSPAASVDMVAPYIKSRQYDLAIEQLRKSLEMHPNFYLGHFVLGWTLINKNEFAQGIVELEKSKDLEYMPFTDGALGYAHAKAGQKDKARKILNDLKLQSKQRQIPAYWIAVIHYGLGENDEAFVWLEKAYREKSFWLLWLKTEPIFDDLRPDPRFQDLTRRVGLIW
jgi:TolB-like protein/DNA-binding winged helix-turn-helix (wHTH) protein